MHNYYFYVTHYKKEDCIEWDILQRNDHFIHVNNYFVLVFTRLRDEHYYWLSYSKAYDNNITFYTAHDHVIVIVKNKRNFGIKTINIKNIPISDVNKLLKHHNLWK